MIESQALNLVVQASAGLLDVLSRSRSFLENMLGESDDFVVIVNRELKILWANKRLKSMWKQSYANRSLLERVPESEHLELRRIIGRLRHINQDVHFESPLCCEGEIIPCFWSARFLDVRHEGPVAHELFCLSGADISALSILKREASLKREYQRLILFSSRTASTESFKDLLQLTTDLLAETGLMQDDQLSCYVMGDATHWLSFRDGRLHTQSLPPEKAHHLADLNPSRPLVFEGTLASYAIFSAESALVGVIEVGIAPRILADKEQTRLFAAVMNTFAAAWSRIRYRAQLECSAEHRSTKVAVGFLQRGLFGSTAPKGAAILPFYLPTDRCGGDWYSVYPSTPGCATLYLADVTGHGMGSALVAGFMNGLVKSCHEVALQTLGNAPVEKRLEAVLKRVSRTIFESYEARFLASMIALEINPAKREVVMINAGHVAPMFYSTAADSVGVLVTASNLVGLSLHPEFQSERLVLGKNDSVLVYSDGVIEHNGGQAMRLDRRELRRLFMEFGRRNMTWEDLTDRLRDYMPYQLTDDVTVLAVQFS